MLSLFSVLFRMVLGIVTALPLLVVVSLLLLVIVIDIGSVAVSVRVIGCVIVNVIVIAVL